jgi:hypothetical protein
MARKYPQYFLALALTSAAFFSPALAQAADIAPELSFHSTKEWVMQQEGKNCSLQTTFNNGFILRFDGGPSWVDTLAVDFVQDIFTLDKSYEVKLDVPGVQTLKTKSTATTPRMLDISLRSHKDFFNALGKSSVLDLQIEKNNFRFYMTGFSKPVAAFEKCMSGKALADPLISAQAENYAVNDAVALEEGTKNTLNTDAKAPYSPPDSTPKPAAVSEPEPTLPQDKPTKPQAAAPQAQAPGFVPKNAALSPEKLAAMVAQQTGDISEMPDVKEEPALAPIEAKNVEAAPAVLPHEPLAEAPSEHENYSTPEMKVTKNSFRAEADFRDEGLPAGEKLSTADMARLAEMEELVQKLKAENIALNEEVKTSVSASEEERLSIASDNWNLEQATMRFNEAERQIKRLGQELQQERAKCEAEKKDLEASLFDPQITGQEQLAKLAALEQELAQVKEENAQLRQGQSQAAGASNSR